MIICITGLAGSGKTTFAKGLIQYYKFLGYNSVHHINSDIIADQVLNITIDDYDYTDKQLSIIYSTLFNTIEEIVKHNPNAIIITDGMYRKASQRIILSAIAERNNHQFKLLYMNTPPQVSKSRLEKRRKDGDIGGWVDPAEYNPPEYESKITIPNIDSEDELIAKSRGNVLNT